MKKTVTIILAFTLNLCIGQTHTFERQVQSSIYTLEVFKNPFDSSIYTWKQIEYFGSSNEINLAKTDTAGTILSNIAFQLGVLNYNHTIIPFSNGFITGGQESFGNSSSNMTRFDNSGNVIWTESYNAFNGVNSRPVIVDELNNVILSIGKPINVGLNNFLVYILKTDLSGAVISVDAFQMINPTGTALVPADLIKLNSGNYLFVTNLLSNGTQFSQVLLELDPAFGIVSSKRLVTSQGDPTYSIKYIKKPDDGFYIAGNFLNTSPSYDTHGFVINFSPSFTQLWAKYTNNTAGPYGLLFTDGKLTPDGGLMIGGTYTSPSGYDDMMLMKVDSSGNLNWAKAIGDSSNDERLSSFVYEPNDAIYLAGNGYDTAQSASTINGLFLKTDLSGNTTCGSSLLPVGFNTMNVTLNNETFTTSTLTITNSALLTSPFPGFTFIPSCDGVVTGIENNDSYFNNLNIFPNPASTGFQITNFNFQKDDELIFSDVLGKISFAKKIQSPTSDLRLQTSDLSNGIYFLEIKTKEGVLNKKVAVKH